ncbi:MAG TPA: hypothetical protein VF941_08800 [Clostridia bacterium]
MAKCIFCNKEFEESNPSKDAEYSCSVCGNIEISRTAYASEEAHKLINDNKEHLITYVKEIHPQKVIINSVNYMNIIKKVKPFTW